MVLKTGDKIRFYRYKGEGPEYEVICYCDDMLVVKDPETGLSFMIPEGTKVIYSGQETSV